MRHNDVTEQVAHLIPANSLGLTYKVVEHADGFLFLEVYQGWYLLGLAGLWNGWFRLRTPKVGKVRHRHINKAIKSLQNKGVITWN